MRIAALFSALIVSLSGLHAQEDTAHHREVYAEINGLEKSLKQSKATCKDDELVFELQGWSDGKELRKIVASTPGEDGAGSDEYYLENGKPLFVFSHYTISSAADSKAPKKVENRFYFKDGKLFKWLKDEKATVDPKDPDFTAEAERLTGNFNHFVEALGGKADKQVAAAAKVATGTFIGVEEGDYAHWLMKSDKGEELSFFILSGDASVDKVLEKPKSYIGKKCRVQLKTSMEEVPEAGGKMEVMQVLSVEWVDKK